MRLLWLAPALAVFATAAGAQRPTTAVLKKLGPAAATLTNIQYTSDTTGTADITLGIFSKEATPIVGAAFTGLQLKDEDVEKIALTTPAEKKYAALGGALVLAKGSQIAYDATKDADPCQITGGGRLELPLVNAKTKKPIALGVPSLKFVTQPKISVTITGANLLNASDASDGIDLDGLALRLTSGVNATFTTRPKPNANPPESELTWSLQFPQVRLDVPLPSGVVKDDKPLTFLVGDLKLSPDGAPTFAQAGLAPDSAKALQFLNPTGFELSVKSGALAMTDGNVTGFSLVSDVLFPASFTNRQGQRASLKSLNLQVKDGVIASFTAPANAPLELLWQGMALKTTGVAVDFSVTNKAPGAFGDAASDEWTGVAVSAATLELPASLGAGQGKPSTVGVTNFLIDGTGVSGVVTFSPAQTLKVGGFSASELSGALTLDDGQVKEGAIGAKLAIPQVGTLGVGVNIASDGRFSISAKPGQKLSLTGLGADIAVKEARLLVDPNSGISKIFVTGELSFDKKKCPQMEGVTVGIKDFGFDTAGKIYLPEGGKLDLPKPLTIDLKAVKVSAREIGFEGADGRVDAIRLTGGVQFPKEIPITGKIDFKGLKIARGNPDPVVTVEGIAVEARIDGVGSLNGEIVQRRAPAGAPPTDLGGYFFGKAQVQLDALKGAGLGLNLLISDKKAWFVGGNAQIPTPLLIAPSQPVLGVYGFSGGFGYNVAKKPGFSGRVTGPDDLIFQQSSGLAQAGVLLGDPAGGLAWWGELNLTGSFTGFRIDEIELAGRATFLNDPVNNKVRFVASASDWDKMDRTAYIVISLEPQKPRFTATAGLDFNIPTRDAALIAFGGQAQFKFAPNDTPRAFYIALGWPDAPINLKPLSVDLAKVAGKNLEIGAKGGLLLDLSDTIGPNLPQRSIRGGAFLDAYAKGSLGPVKAGIDLKGRIAGVLVVERAGQKVFPEFTGNGRVSLDGWVEIPVLGKATAGGSLDADLSRTLLVLDGKVYGSLDTFLGKVRKDFEVKVEIKR